MWNNDGRIDEVADHIYTFELKLDKDADEALKQIEDHQCYQKYQLREKLITLVEVNFNSDSRTVDWKPEEYGSVIMPYPFHLTLAQFLKFR